MCFLDKPLSVSALKKKTYKNVTYLSTSSRYTVKSLHTPVKTAVFEKDKSHQNFCTFNVNITTNATENQIEIANCISLHTLL